MAEKKLSFALAGNPNCGKTTLFNSLTGSTAYVGNWPGVTVEKRTGTYKDNKGFEAEIVDLPGIYSLSPYTPEEVISRNYILENHPDCVINVLDATNLERNLYMTTQILEMDVPVVVALNMMDAVKENGMSIDVDAISKKLGVPVVEISALRELNLDKLMEAAKTASANHREGKSFWDYGNYSDAVIKAVDIYKSKKVEDPLFHAIKALEGDEIEAQKNIDAFAEVKALNIDVDEFEANSADKRYKYITAEISIHRTGAPVQESKKLSKSDKIDKVLTNKWAAIPILIVVMFLIFHITFAGDLFFLNKMGVVLEDYPGFISWTMLDGSEVRPFAGLFYDGDGIVSIGEFFHRLAGDNETGILGCICLAIKQALLAMNAPDALIMFIYDGVLNGVAAVLGFVPQILILFLFFSILEDSGYMARVAFVLDRIFRRFGVSGRAFLPMIMGLGCGIPAMINTRTLNSDKERVKTIRVIPYFTCGAKADILAAVSAAVAGFFGWQADLFTFGMYLMGMVMAIVMVIVMNKTSQRETVPPFIMELPAYHMPQAKAVGIHVWDKGKHFLKKAFTIILVSTVVLTLMENLTWSWQFIPAYEDADLADIQALGYASYEAMEASSMLSGIGKLLQPIFTPLGFGSQLGDTGWVYSVASIQGIIAKENVTGTLETLSSIVGETMDVQGMFEVSGITQGGVLGFTVFNLLTIPCFASVGTAKGEMPSKKDYLGTLAFWVLGAYVVAAIFYVFTDAIIGNWGLALQIILPIVIVALLVLAGFGLHLYDVKKKKEEAAIAA
jgi:ferrous iron transport protein B